MIFIINNENHPFYILRVLLADTIKIQNTAHYSKSEKPLGEESKSYYRIIMFLEVASFSFKRTIY